MPITWTQFIYVNNTANQQSDLKDRTNKTEHDVSKTRQNLEPYMQQNIYLCVYLQHKLATVVRYSSHKAV